MSSLSVEFKNEGFYGDVIEASIFIGEISKAAFELYYQLKTIRKEREIILALAKTDMVTYNYVLKRIEAIPTTFKILTNPF